MPADGTFGVPPAPVSPRDPHKTLTKEELTATVERLNRVHPHKEDNGPLVSSKKMTKEEMGSSVDRLYSQAMHTRKAQAELAEKKAHPDLVKHIKRDESELDGAFNRIYLVKDTQKANMERLLKLQAEKELKESNTPRGGSPPKKLTKDDIASSARRLHDEALAKSREKQDKLLEKYVYATDVKMPKRTPEEIAEAANRLSSRDPK